jgi:hypothetical protein
VAGQLQTPAAGGRWSWGYSSNFEGTAGGVLGNGWAASSTGAGMSGRSKACRFGGSGCAGTEAWGVGRSGEATELEGV